jgi:hypothetical protein
MKKLWSVLVLTLAINFLAVAGGVGWLYQTGRMDRDKVMAIKDLLFPPPPPAAPTTQPTEVPASQPSLKLEELLAKHAGLPAAEQLALIRQSFDSQMAQLDRAYRGLVDLQRQVDLAQKQLAVDRAALEKRRKELDIREKQTERLATDQGFQDTLSLYQSMPAKQVKAMFMTLDDQMVVQYLQAMEGRAAARITKEFKTPEELDRLKRIMEKLRTAQANVGP